MKWTKENENKWTASTSNKYIEYDCSVIIETESESTYNVFADIDHNGEDYSTTNAIVSIADNVSRQEAEREANRFMQTHKSFKSIEKAYEEYY